MQPEMCWQLRSPRARKASRRRVGWKGKGNNLGGTSEEDGAWAGCVPSAGAAHGWSPGRLFHPRERGRPVPGLAGWAQAGGNRSDVSVHPSRCPRDDPQEPLEGEGAWSGPRPGPPQRTCGKRSLPHPHTA